MRVAVVENMENSLLGTLGQALDEAGAEIEWFRSWQDGVVPAGVDAHDALIVLGGVQSAVDDAAFPTWPGSRA
jgi:GMP synthase (glutamine-hydrolysing)